MRILSVYSLLLLAVLTSCGGCQEINSALNPTPDPKCRVATQTVKNLIGPNQTSTEGTETVTIGGESYRVSTTKKSVYTYDAQGRILTEHNTYSNNKADSVLYRYTPGAVTIRTVNLMATPRTESTGKLVLNENGFLEDQGYLKVTYDKEGYQLTKKGENLTYKIVNGNEVETLLTDPDRPPGYTIKNKYDLTKPGLIPIKTFYGRKSRNLRLSYALRENRPFGESAEERNGVYSYIFDRDGLVLREIQRYTDGEVVYIFSGGLSVTVNDYTYICP